MGNNLEYSLEKMMAQDFLLVVAINHLMETLKLKEHLMEISLDTH